MRAFLPKKNSMYNKIYFFEILNMIKKNTQLSKNIEVYYNLMKLYD